MKGVNKMLDQQKINGVPCAYMGCCGIFAASLVTGKEPQEIFDLYKKENSMSNRWRDRVHRLEEFGVTEPPQSLFEEYLDKMEVPQ